ncbi:putative transmembrane protein [Toxoplasma gondii VAND]|uniref:Putative transmembrane protein n=1 Tax=Toxoplasma gondii VAND TaxID=933077 RepID=A0A086PI91_TOXGO|nr:putative transmembrane protein [Toxoplasma gondii VAND]
MLEKRKQRSDLDTEAPSLRSRGPREVLRVKKPQKNTESGEKNSQRKRRNGYASHMKDGKHELERNSFRGVPAARRCLSSLSGCAHALSKRFSLIPSRKAGKQRESLGRKLLRRQKTLHVDVVECLYTRKKTQLRLPPASTAFSCFACVYIFLFREI